MNQHLTDQDLLQYRQRAPGSGMTAVAEHLAGCQSCRSRLENEEKFDLGLTRRLTREQAPPALLLEIQAGLGRESARQQTVRFRQWRRLATGALAATVIAILGLMAVWNPSSQELPGVAGDVVLTESDTRSIRGQLVCVGCARGGADMKHQRACRGGGDLHVTGLRTSDGNLWRFMDGEPIREYLHQPQLRGAWLQIQARPFPDIGYLQIAAVQRL